MVSDTRYLIIGYPNFTVIRRIPVKYLYPNSKVLRALAVVPASRADAAAVDPARPEAVRSVLHTLLAEHAVAAAAVVAPVAVAPAHVPPA